MLTQIDSAGKIRGTALRRDQILAIDIDRGGTGETQAYRCTLGADPDELDWNGRHTDGVECSPRECASLLPIGAFVDVQHLNLHPSILPPAHLARRAMS